MRAAGEGPEVLARLAGEFEDPEVGEFGEDAGIGDFTAADFDFFQIGQEAQRRDVPDGAILIRRLDPPEFSFRRVLFQVGPR